MTCRDIYSAALAMICENNEGHSDYDDRVPYLLAAVCNQLEALDRVIRQARGEEIPAYPDGIYMDPDEDFPLSEDFITAVSYYLGAMLVMDENEEMFEDLFALYSDAVAKIQSTIPYHSAPITDVYRELI